MDPNMSELGQHLLDTGIAMARVQAEQICADHLPSDEKLNKGIVDFALPPQLLADTGLQDD